MFKHTKLIYVLFACLGISLMTGCGGSRVELAAVQDNPAANSQEAAPVTGGQQAAAWPLALPEDAVQPWESATAEGYVRPEGRIAKSINAFSDFTPGVERYDAGGGVTDLAEASRLAATPGGVVFATYRIVLGGDQPGAISVDANLASAQSEYWVGVSDYSVGAWRWSGPFADPQMRLSLPMSDYLSGAGNLFVTVLAYDGAQLDVVGIGTNPRDAADAIAPPAPSALGATAVSSGLKLEWTASAAGDLAGYRVYWSYSPIPDSLVGAHPVPYLIGMTSHLLQVPQRRVVYARVAAVDVSGNQSMLSPQVNALPESGAMPGVVLLTDQASGPFGLDANLTASGAELYDWDLDGDGVFDVTDDATGSQNVSITEAGIIRPAVIGKSGGGISQARGAVSLIVSANERPEAACWASPASGMLPLEVTFTGAGVDSDGSIVDYSWDFNGDKTYDWSSSSSANPPAQIFTDPGLYNAVLRVEDNNGAWATDQVAVLVNTNIPPVLNAELSPRRILGTNNLTQSITISFLGSYDPEGTTLTCEYKRPGLTYWEDLDPGVFTGSFLIDDTGAYDLPVRVRDEDGGITYGSLYFEVYTFGANYVPYPSADFGRYTDISVGQGHIAITFVDAATNNLVSCSGDALNPGDFTYFTTVTNLGADPYYEMNRDTYHIPAIVYYSPGAGDLMYKEARDRNCSGWYAADTLVSSGDVGKYCTIALNDYYQGVAYFNDTDNKIYYMQAENAHATSWSAPVAVTPVGGDYRDLSLAIVNGRPCIAYYRVVDTGLYFARASSSDGSAWEAPIEIDTHSGDLGQSVKLLEVANRPAVAYFDLTLGDEAIYYLRAEDTTGGSWDDSTRKEVRVCGSAASALDMAIIDGRPAIAADPGYGWALFSVASEETGLVFWEDVSTEPSGIMDLGQYCSLADYYGLPAMAYYDETNNQLRFARGIVP